MTSPVLVFDLDGTLVETAPDLVSTLNVVLGREGIDPVPYDRARAMIGNGARHMIEHGLRERGAPIDPAEVDRMFDGFIAHYADHIADESRPFPGLEDALDRLADKGFLLAVCTNKLEGLSRLLLEALDMTSRFAAICGQDTFGVKKPDPIVLHRTIAKAGGDPARAIMIGDSVTDIDTARAAGIPVIAVDFGYTTVPVTELSPDAVISHFDALDDAVHRLMS